MEAGPAVWSMLAGTGFGHAWLVGAFFTLGMPYVSFVSAVGKRASVRDMGGVGGVALARSNGGHPVDAGLFSLPVWVDWLHLLAISAWVGLVLVTYVVVPRLLDAPGSERQTSASFVQSLSDIDLCA
jgi:putative copper resistance protein D